MNHRAYSNGPLSPAMREKRTVDVVKSILSKVKERAISSGPLLSEEEAAINQLEQLYVAKFLRPSQDDSVFPGTLADGKRRDNDLYPSSLTPSRRDSDASYSNDTYSSTILSAPRGRPRKDRDYYNSRDPWRRHWQRRKRQDLRKLVEPLPLSIDEARGVHLVDAVVSVYEELLHEGKRPLAAYDLLITTLRSYFGRETWPDLVDAYVVQFVQNHILLSAAEVTEKYSGSSRGIVERLDEYKLQALLHLFALPSDVDARSDKLDEVVEVLRVILESFGGSTALQRFLDEDILETFLDTMPHDLAHVYQELDISVPSELNGFSSGSKGSDEKSEQPASSAKNVVSTTSTSIPPLVPRKRGRPPLVKPTFLVAPAPSNGTTVKAEASKPKKIKIEQSLNDIEEAVEPEVKSSETTPIMPIIEEKKKEQAKAQARPKKVKDAESHPVTKVIAETPSASAVLVSVRQSPRHHASTRALYGSASNTLSLLMQKEQTEGTGRNGSLEIPAATPELLNDSTRLVLVKDKRGYLLKKFLHDGNSGNDEGGTDFSAMESVTSKSNGTFLSNLEEEAPEKVVGKLTLKLKKAATKKKAATTLSRQGASGKATPQQTKSSKTPIGRTEQRQRITFTKTKCRKGSGEGQSSLVSPASRAGEKKNQPAAASNGRNEHTISIKSALKASKSLPTIMDRSESGASKSSKSKSGGGEKGKNVAYALPAFAVENYVKHVNEIRRERKRARIDPEDGDELFYARGTRRHSIFYDGGDCVRSKGPASKCYTNEQMAPKNRTGRKMKSSVEVFHLANYLLNIQNANPSTPAIPKNLQQALNTPIRLYKKLRLAPKNNRRRSLRQFCSLKFNGEEFKNSLDNTSGTSNSSTIGEERTSNDADECASLELNCAEPRTATPKEEARRRDLKMTLTIDTRLPDSSPRRNSVSVCAGLTKGSPKTWTVNGRSSGEREEHSDNEPTNGYYLRRRRLFSDGHVSSVGSSSIISPDVNGGKRGMALRGRVDDLEDAKKKLKEGKDVVDGDGLVLTIGSRSAKGGVASSGVAEKEYFVIANGSLCGQLLDEHVQKRSSGEDEEQSGDSFLNHLSSHAGGLLQLANPSSLLCTGLTAKNYAQVAADVR